MTKKDINFILDVYIKCIEKTMPLYYKQYDIDIYYTNDKDKDIVLHIDLYTNKVEYLMRIPLEVKKDKLYLKNDYIVKNYIAILGTMDIYSYDKDLTKTCIWDVINLIFHKDTGDNMSCNTLDYTSINHKVEI